MYQELWNPVNGSIATNLTPFLWDRVLYLYMLNHQKSSTAVAFSWLYIPWKPQKKSHGPPQKNAAWPWFSDASQHSGEFFADDPEIFINSSNLLCIYPQVVPTDLFRLVVQKSCKKKVDINKHQPFPEQVVPTFTSQLVIFGSPNFPVLNFLVWWRSLAFLLTTSLIWHAAAPSIKVTPDSEVVFLKGTKIKGFGRPF